MGQEYYLMKTFKIAAATAVLALASGYAAAAPTVTTTTHQTEATTYANYYIATRLSLATTNLQFPSIVKPASGASSNTVTVGFGTSNALTVSYNNTDANPGVNGQNAAFGTVTVSGDTNYVVGVIFTPPTTIGAVSLSNITSVSGEEVTTAPPLPSTPQTADINVQLNAGTATIQFGGKLTVTSSATLGASTTSTAIPVTVTAFYQ